MESGSRQGIGWQIQRGPWDLDVHAGTGSPYSLQHWLHARSPGGPGERRQGEPFIVKDLSDYQVLTRYCNDKTLSHLE